MFVLYTVCPETRHTQNYQGGQNRAKKKSLGHVCVILSWEILKLYVSQIKKLSQFLLLTVNI